jgi:putative sterol carrier protein
MSNGISPPVVIRGNSIEVETSHELQPIKSANEHYMYLLRGEERPITGVAIRRVDIDGSETVIKLPPGKYHIAVLVGDQVDTCPSW